MNDDKAVALVTGGSAGLGEHIALDLCREGFEVVVCGRRQDKLDAMLARGVGVFQCDVSQPEDVLRLKSWLAARHGRLDVLVNCAGIALQRGKFVEVDLAEVEKLMRTNVFGTMHVTQALLPLLHARKGSIINFSSTLAQRPRAGSIAYSASKGAVEAFTRALAIEAAEYGVRVNCIAPGLVRSDIYIAAGMSTADYDKLLRARAAEFPLRRVGEPEDVCGLVSYLVAPRASWITGQVFAVDGGAMLR
jgi:NAD(P)-dependent dehydrogenase (short-subunit alcohol dehydrogenase family)